MGVFCQTPDLFLYLICDYVIKIQLYVYRYVNSTLIIPYYTFQVQRQEEPLLITAVTELARGNLTPETEAFVKSLEGHVPVPQCQKRVLFATNDDVDMYNLQQIHDHRGKLHSYTASDTGSTHQVEALGVPKVCFIKFTKLHFKSEWRILYSYETHKLL